jgi:hypothetical protein
MKNYYSNEVHPSFLTSLMLISSNWTYTTESAPVSLNSNFDPSKKSLIPLRKTTKYQIFKIHIRRYEKNYK